MAGADQTTDINTIPASLIRQTEVVTGGSSAVYGLGRHHRRGSTSSCARDFEGVPS
ncbi:hypothetical protein ACRAWD_00765 [Caulobacter segnis]